MLIAALASDTPIVNLQVLLDAGADVSLRTEDGVSALLTAILRGSPEMMQLLLIAGADPNEQIKDSFPILAFAASTSTPEKVQILLDGGADSSFKDSLGNTAWDYAQQNENIRNTNVYWHLNDARFK